MKKSTSRFNSRLETGHGLLAPHPYLRNRACHRRIILRKNIWLNERCKSSLRFVEVGHESGLKSGEMTCRFPMNKEESIYGSIAECIGKWEEVFQSGTAVVPFACLDGGEITNASSLAKPNPTRLCLPKRRLQCHPTLNSRYTHMSPHFALRSAIRQIALRAWIGPAITCEVLLKGWVLKHHFRSFLRMG